MADVTDNHTIKLLQEMRREMNERFDTMDQRFDGVDVRIDGLTHIVTMLAGHTSHLDERVEALEKEKPK